MKLLIKQRVFAWTDTYDVYDEQEIPKYFIKAEVFAFGHQLHVYDRNELLLGIIHQKLLSLMPVFEIEVNGEIIGSVRKHFTFFSNDYEVDYMGWEVKGDIFGWDYDVFSNNDKIINIQKEIMHWSDTYVIDILHEKDELHGLLLVLAIDAANCKN